MWEVQPAFRNNGDREDCNMKSTGIVRKMDTLGRVVIPIELRRTLGIDIKDSIEIFVDKETIILKKYHPACFFCDNANDLVSFQGKSICHECLDKIKTME